MKALATAGGCLLPLDWVIVSQLGDSGTPDPAPSATGSRAGERPLTPAEESAWRQLTAVLRDNDK